MGAESLPSSGFFPESPTTIALSERNVIQMSFDLFLPGLLRPLRIANIHRVQGRTGQTDSPALAWPYLFGFLKQTPQPDRELPGQASFQSPVLAIV